MNSCLSVCLSFSVPLCLSPPFLPPSLLFLSLHVENQQRALIALNMQDVYEKISTEEEPSVKTGREPREA